MSELKYKVGDRVRIKNFDWFRNEGAHNMVVAYMKKYYGEVVTIKSVHKDFYRIKEDDWQYCWTDEMIECKVEEETKSELKFKVGDKVRIKSLDWYNENKDEYGDVKLFVKDMSEFCGDIMTIKRISGIYYIMEESAIAYGWTDEMIEGLVEEETPKFKVNDIVFVRNIGLVRITNSYWDSLANEHIYEAIGFNGEGEYDSINQSNIGYLMLSESMIPHTGGDKITIEEYKNNDKEWLFNKLAMLDNITALESIQDIFNYLQQSKYPKTYEECCQYLGCEDRIPLKIIGEFTKLINARNAYWKLYGEEMGLDKPWEPDYNEESYEQGSSIKYVIYYTGTHITKGQKCTPSYVLAFPTEEMRDIFYENFKEEIEFVKELL